MFDYLRSLSKGILFHLSDRGQQVVDLLYDLSVDKGAMEHFADYRLTDKQRRELDAYLTGARAQVQNNGCEPDGVKRALMVLAFVQVAVENPRKKVFIPTDFFSERGDTLYAMLKNWVPQKDLLVRNDHIRFVGSPERNDMLSLLGSFHHIAYKQKVHRRSQEIIEGLVQALERKRNMGQKDG